MYLTQIHKDPAKGISGTEAISEFNKISGDKGNKWFRHGPILARDVKSSTFS